jgi:hypothetical protein
MYYDFVRENLGEHWQQGSWFSDDYDEDDNVTDDWAACLGGLLLLAKEGEANQSVRNGHGLVSLACTRFINRAIIELYPDTVEPRYQEDETGLWYIPIEHDCRLTWSEDLIPRFNDNENVRTSDINKVLDHAEKLEDKHYDALDALRYFQKLAINE